MEYDFGGYATKNDIQCSDGRIIRRNAFKDNDGMTVPLVWQHVHNDPTNVLGHALLENRPDGVYAYCKLNKTEKAEAAKEIISHGDVDSLSIFATQLTQQGNSVVHGAIKEVSLCLAGANPEAVIDNLCIAHADGQYVDIDDEAVISYGEPLNFGYYNNDRYLSHSYYEDYLYHADDEDEDEDEGDGETIGEIFDTLNEKQKNVVYAIVGQALHDAGKPDGGEEMKHNVFDSENLDRETTLSHAQFSEIVEDAKRVGSLKESFLAHAQDYGIENIDILFPDAKNVTPTPDWIKRETDWVAGVISGTHHTPFSRIKSTAADITADEARAKGYMKGNRKTEEVFKLLKRVTTPTTIYKKQKLDRDDIIDITTIDVVAWLKQEMRLMLDEEVARAILVGDGRDASSEDKINEENIRPIWKEDELYAHHVVLEDGFTPSEFMEAVIRSKKEYKGSGNPALYLTTDQVVDMLLQKDQIGRFIYESESALTSKMRVSKLVEVPVMENQTRTNDAGETLQLVAIMINLKDYTVGADKGGQISMFDDFDIDYNQYKYLMETRMSGCLVHPKSAIIFEKKVTGGTGRKASLSKSESAGAM